MPRRITIRFRRRRGGALGLDIGIRLLPPPPQSVAPSPQPSLDFSDGSLNSQYFILFPFV